MTGVDLNLLVAFDALVSERNVTRAAERLGIGQPAMSASLARLRRLFDDPLLVREGHTYTTTPLAESMAAPVRDALATIDGLLATRRTFDPGTDQRTFRVMASDYVALVLLRPLLADLARESPRVRLHIAPLTADHVDQVRRGQVDLLVIPDELLREPHPYSTKALFTDRYVCAVAADHPEIDDRLSLEQLSTEPYLAYRAGDIASLAERQLDTAGVTRNLEITVETFLLAPYLLAGTRLVTLLQERHARSVREQLGLRLVELPVALRPITEVMTWAPRFDRDPAHTWLRQRIVKLAGNL